MLIHVGQSLRDDDDDDDEELEDDEELDDDELDEELCEELDDEDDECDELDDDATVPVSDVHAFLSGRTATVPFGQTRHCVYGLPFAGVYKLIPSQGVHTV